MRKGYTTYTWTVEFDWVYNAKEISKRAQDYMREEESLDYREALREIISDLVSGEDDGLYYNFNEQCYEDIIDDIENKYPCDERYEQLKLF